MDEQSTKSVPRMTIAVAALEKQDGDRRSDDRPTIADPSLRRLVTGNDTHNNDQPQHQDDYLIPKLKSNSTMKGWLKSVRGRLVPTTKNDKKRDESSVLPSSSMATSSSSATTPLSPIKSILSSPTKTLTKSATRLFFRSRSAGNLYEQTYSGDELDDDDAIESTSITQTSADSSPFDHSIDIIPLLPINLLDTEQPDLSSPPVSGRRLSSVRTTNPPPRDYTGPHLGRTSNKTTSRRSKSVGADEDRMIANNNTLSPSRRGKKSIRRPSPRTSLSSQQGKDDLGLAGAFDSSKSSSTMNMSFITAAAETTAAAFASPSSKREKVKTMDAIKTAQTRFRTRSSSIRHLPRSSSLSYLDQEDHHHHKCTSPSQSTTVRYSSIHRSSGDRPKMEDYFSSPPSRRHSHFTTTTPGQVRSATTTRSSSIRYCEVTSEGIVLSPPPLRERRRSMASTSSRRPSSSTRDSDVIRSPISPKRRSSTSIHDQHMNDHNHHNLPFRRSPAKAHRRESGEITSASQDQRRSGSRRYNDSSHQLQLAGSPQQSPKQQHRFEERRSTSLSCTKPPISSLGLEEETSSPSPSLPKPLSRQHRSQSITKGVMTSSTRRSSMDNGSSPCDTTTNIKITRSPRVVKEKLVIHSPTTTTSTTTTTFHSSSEMSPLPQLGNVVDGARMIGNGLQRKRSVVPDPDGDSSSDWRTSWSWSSSSSQNLTSHSKVEVVVTKEEETAVVGQEKNHDGNNDDQKVQEDLGIFPPNLVHW